MYARIRLYISLTRHRRRVAWNALQRFFERCYIAERVRPSFLYVTRDRYEYWERVGHASRRGTIVALKYVRLYTGLRALLGDDTHIVDWLHSPHARLSPAAPVLWRLVHSEQALDTVLGYLEAELYGR